jgi:hypothetical protein
LADALPYSCMRFNSRTTQLQARRLLICPGSVICHTSGMGGRPFLMQSLTCGRVLRGPTSSSRIHRYTNAHGPGVKQLPLAHLTT